MYLEACGLDGDRVAGCLWPDVVALPLDEPLISQYPGIDKYLDHRLGGATRVVLKACQGLVTFPQGSLVAGSLRSWALDEL